MIDTGEYVPLDPDEPGRPRKAGRGAAVGGRPGYGVGRIAGGVRVCKTGAERWTP